MKSPSASSILPRIIFDPFLLLFSRKEMEGVSKSEEEKLHLLIMVLERAFSGLKIQLKPTKYIDLLASPKADADRRLSLSLSSSGFPPNRFVLEEVLLVCKWGGVLTHSGIQQVCYFKVYIKTHSILCRLAMLVQNFCII
jgi:hypothetical protein